MFDDLLLLQRLVEAQLRLKDIIPRYVLWSVVFWTYRHDNPSHSVDLQKLDYLGGCGVDA